MDSYLRFEDLEFWKKAREFRIKMSKLLKTFPKEERYGLVSQLKRSSRSIAANIAEGHGRFHYQENIQFCRIARGSLMESLEHLICAFDEEYITKDQLNNYRKDYNLLLKLANGYVKYLKSQKSKK